MELLDKFKTLAGGPSIPPPLFPVEVQETVKMQSPPVGCPYAQDQLDKYRQSHPHLICCPATTPAWNWRYRDYCQKCKTNCKPSW